MSLLACTPFGRPCGGAGRSFLITWGHHASSSLLACAPHRPLSFADLIRVSLVVLGLLLACTSGLASSTYIFNESPAHQCFTEADKRAPPYSVEDCDLALDHEPLSLKNRAATFSNRGIVHRKLNNWEKALKDQDMAIELMPELSGAHINRGNILMAMKRYPEAMEAFDESIALTDENLPLAYYNRALLFRLLGDQKSAKDDASRAAELDPLQDQYETLAAELAGAQN